MNCFPNENTCNVIRERRGVDDARRFAGLMVLQCDHACREAIEMAVTELAENLVKYCEPSAGEFAGSITIRNENNVVKILATNLAASDADATLVKESIATLESAEALEVYRARLAVLFTSPGLERGRLGLLRLAYEGGFRLSCHHAAPVLVIEAERPCTAT
jgi:hypothetical protein